MANKSTRPVGRPREFPKGYQAALTDILAALDRGGEDEAREWIRNNMINL